MNIAKRSGDGTLTFVEFAKDHREHVHCVSCSGCIIDPSPHVRFFLPIWCVGCRDRILDGLPNGVEPPWLWVSSNTTEQR